MSNFSNFASRTPRATFSKSQKSAMLVSAGAAMCVFASLGWRTVPHPSLYSRAIGTRRESHMSDEIATWYLANHASHIA